MPAPGTRSRRAPAPPGIFARLGSGVKLEAHATGTVVAYFDGYSMPLGSFGSEGAGRAQELRTGLPLSSLPSRGGASGKEVELLVKRLAGHGLLEYRVGRLGNGGEDLAVIEPQAAGFWPEIRQLNDGDFLVLSCFAYMRRRGDDMVLESPRSAALVKICDPKLAGLLAMLSAPKQIRQLRSHEGFPGIEFLSVLVSSEIASKIDGGSENKPLQPAEDDSLVLWDFHDLLFHARSTEGRHTNPLGGVYPHTGAIAQLPAVRPPWPGHAIDLRMLPGSGPESTSPFAKLLRERRSVRDFDDRHPITLTELSRFLESTARIVSTSDSDADAPGGAHEETVRPYPSAGGSYELELYLAVNKCDGLAQGFYHYDAAAHGLVKIAVPPSEVKALLMRASYAMDAPAAPQILITIAARFGRVSWKYSSIAYSLILKDVGVLTQTLYLAATDMGLGGCAIGIVNIDQFAKMTGLESHIEGPVGLFALGRGVKAKA